MSDPQQTFAIEADAGLAHAVGVAAASLPLRTLGAADGTPIQVISGTSGWPGRVAEALASDAAGVLLVGPVPEPTDALDGIDSDVPIAVDAGWATTAASDVLGDELGEIASAGDVLEVHSSVTAADEVPGCLLAQAVLLRSVGFPVTAARRLVATTGSTVVSAETAGGLRALLVARVTTAVEPSTELRVVGASGTVSATLPDARTAAPTRIHTITERGDLLHPTVYESGHRVALARLLDAVASGTAADDLAALRADVDTLRAASA